MEDAQLSNNDWMVVATQTTPYHRCSYPPQQRLSGGSVYRASLLLTLFAIYPLQHSCDAVIDLVFHLSDFHCPDCGYCGVGSPPLTPIPVRYADARVDSALTGSRQSVFPVREKIDKCLCTIIGKRSVLPRPPCTIGSARALIACLLLSPCSVPTSTLYSLHIVAKAASGPAVCINISAYNSKGFYSARTPLAVPCCKCWTIAHHLRLLLLQTVQHLRPKCLVGPALLSDTSLRHDTYSAVIESDLYLSTVGITSCTA